VTVTGRPHPAQERGKLVTHDRLDNGAAGARALRAPALVETFDFVIGNAEVIDVLLVDCIDDFFRGEPGENIGVDVGPDLRCVIVGLRLPPPCMKTGPRRISFDISAA
jgi:hypothetical protein